MKILAWVSLVLHGFLLVVYPSLLGKSRGVYSVQTWIGFVIATTIDVALIGRVLGWW